MFRSLSLAFMGPVLLGYVTHMYLIHATIRGSLRSLRGFGEVEEAVNCNLAKQSSYYHSRFSLLS